MRTQKRFTPDLLERFEQLGRSTGTHENYIPWHRVGRSDPASSGRSHLQTWEGRQRELLSDKERVGMLFMAMLPNCEDVLEQFRLNNHSSAHELCRYDSAHARALHPGTLEIADRLKMKHPKVSGQGRTKDWQMTTDFLLVLKLPNDKLEVVAVAGKLDSEILKPRKKRLLSIEREYWIQRGATWLLLTPSLYNPLVADLLRSSMPWALGMKVDDQVIDFVASNSALWQGRSITHALKRLEVELGDMDFAQRALWQAVWCGRLPMDLRRGWRPHEPIVLLDAASFWSLNPIASRRSAWTV